MTWIGGGVALWLGYLTSWFFDPFQKNIPGFLFVFSILFGLYFFLIRKLTDKYISPITIFGFAILFRLTLLPMSPTLSDDIYRYVWDGKVQQAGINPYLYPPAADSLTFLRDENHPLINHPTIRTVYPPVAQFVFRLGYVLKPDVATQKILFVLFDLILIGLIMVALKLKEKPMSWSVIYAWNPLAVLEFSTSGHNDSLMLALLMLALVLYEKRKGAMAYVSFAMAALCKLIPLVMIPWLWVNKCRRFLILYALTLVVLCLPFFSGLFQVSGIKNYAKDWVFNPSLYSMLGYLLPSPLYRKVGIGFLLIFFAFLWAQKNREKPLLYVFGTVYLLLLFSPVVHPWYVLWLLPLLCFYPLWSGLLWTWLVGFTYVVQIRYVAEGVWQLPLWVSILEYSVIFSVLFWEIFHGFRSEKGGTVTLSKTPLPVKKAAQLKTTVIIPALNEEKAISLVINEIPKNLVQDILVVDNGSSDKTSEVARANGARVLFESRRGYGQAVLTGLGQLQPDCDTVVILDGDHSDFPEDLGQLLEPIATGQADLVIGARTQAALPGSLMPQQKFGNWLTCLLIRILYGEAYTDMGPFRAVRRDVLEQMKMEDRNFGWNVEMQSKALQLGLRVWEVPVKYRPRIGTSKISGTLKGSFQAGVIILWSIYKYGWTTSIAPSGK